MPKTEPCGVLLLDKPGGMTSFDCVAKIRRLYHTKKVGHTGTLDPAATGLLPILVGRAAKAADYLTAGIKHYQAVLQLGITTDTQDTTGTVLHTSAGIPDERAVLSILDRFRGDIMQLPPMYAALKINGQKLVDLARRGIEVERQPRPIIIHQLTAVQLTKETYALNVICSKGTYIRTLCHDIGTTLGCGGAMASLRRLETGGFSVADALTFEQLEAMSEDALQALLLPVETLFSMYPAIHLPPFYEKLSKSGCEIYLQKLSAECENTLSVLSPGDYVRLCDSHGFYALGQVQLFTPDNAPAIKPVKRFVL